MRFSAAASPGNSGGPLMDKDGNVVGIVLRKSENENLNYALPIKEMVKAKDNVATLDSMLIYRIDNMPFTSRDTLAENTKLPMDYKKLGDVLMAQMKKFSTSLLDKLVRENKKEIFPNGKGSDVLLSRSYSSIFPSIIARSDDGFWDTYEPKNIENSDLGNNGYMAYGSLGDSLFVRVHKPDDVPLKQFYKNSQLFMDLFLKGITVSRKIGAEEIKIVSMGKPSEEYIHTDSYQRKWQVKIWDSEYSDRKYIAFCLPVPDGYIAMMRSPRSGRISSHIDDLVTLTDFIYVSYYGTLEEWKQFIALKDMIPPVFSSFKLDYKYSDYFKYASQRLAISYSAKDIEITKDSDLELVFSYFKDNNKVIWDVSRIILGANKDQGTFVQVERNVRPPDHINQKYRQKWGDIVEQRTPYDKKIFFEDQRSFIGAAYTSNGKNISNSDLIYTVVYGEDGTSEKEAMKGTLEKFIQNLEVYEISDSKQPASRKKGI